MRDKVFGMARNQGGYFGLGGLTPQPEQGIPGSELVFETPDMQAFQQIPDSPTVSRPNLVKSAGQSTSPGLVSEPPKPILPPSITRPPPRSAASLISEAQQVDSPSDVSENGKSPTNSVKRRRTELQMRVYKARTQMPSHIALRVFREPTECVEVDEIL